MAALGDLKRKRSDLLLEKWSNDNVYAMQVANQAAEAQRADMKLEKLEKKLEAKMETMQSNLSKQSTRIDQLTATCFQMDANAQQLNNKISEETQRATDVEQNLAAKMNELEESMSEVRVWTRPSIGVGVAELRREFIRKLQGHITADGLSKKSFGAEQVGSFKEQTNQDDRWAMQLQQDDFAKAPDPRVPPLWKYKNFLQKWDATAERNAFVHRKPISAYFAAAILKARDNYDTTYGSYADTYRMAFQFAYDETLEAAAARAKPKPKSEAESSTQ